MITKLSKPNYTASLEVVDKGVVIFSAPWCGACHHLIDNVSEADIKDIKLFNVDVSEEEDLTEKLGIRALPTTIAYEYGKEICRLESSQSINTIISMFEN